MKATLKGSYTSERSKSGMSFKYVITGTKAELEALVKTSNFSEYPLYDKVTGEPIVFRNEPLLTKEVNVGINPETNRFYLDDSETKTDLILTEKMARFSKTYAEKFAESSVRKLSGLSAMMDAVSIPSEEPKKEEAKKEEAKKQSD